MSIRHLQKTLQIILILLVFVVVPISAAETDTPVKFGVFPYVSPARLVNFHTPLKNLLSETLEQPVTMTTASDFLSFIDNTSQGQYDFILTAPHLARLAEKESGYQRVLRTRSKVQGIYLVNKNSGIERLEQLKDKKIMIAQRVSVLFKLSEKQLKDHGLLDGKNISIMETRTHNNAMWAPLRGEADAAVTGARLFNSLDHEYKDRLKIIAKTPPVPGLMIMAHPRVPADRVETFQQAGLHFIETPIGQKYFIDTGLRGFALINDTVMQSLDGYLNIETVQ